MINRKTMKILFIVFIMQVISINVILGYSLYHKTFQLKENIAMISDSQDIENNTTPLHQSKSMEKDSKEIAKKPEVNLFFHNESSITESLSKSVDSNDILLESLFHTHQKSLVYRVE